MFVLRNQAYGEMKDRLRQRLPGQLPGLQGRLSPVPLAPSRSSLAPIWNDKVFACACALAPLVQNLHKTMAKLECGIPNVTSKSLLRKASQSASIFSFLRAGFYRFALPKVQRVARLTHNRLVSIHNVSKNVMDEAENGNIARLNASLIQLLEFERSLLGFPSPGRRSNESGKVGGRDVPAILEASDATVEQTPQAASPEPTAPEQGS